MIDDSGSKSNSTETGMKMKTIDFSVEGDFNITIINDENSGDSTTDENHDKGITDMSPEKDGTRQQLIPFSRTG